MAMLAKTPDLLIPRDQLMSYVCSLISLSRIVVPTLAGVCLLPRQRRARSLAVECDATAHRLPCLPTTGAAIQPVFAPPPPRRASSHFSRQARTAVSRNVVNLYPARTDPKSSVHSPPTTAAASCHPFW